MFSFLGVFYGSLCVWWVCVCVCVCVCVVLLVCPILLILILTFSVYGDIWHFAMTLMCFFGHLWVHIYWQERNKQTKTKSYRTCVVCNIWCAVHRLHRGNVDWNIATFKDSQVSCLSAFCKKPYFQRQKRPLPPPFFLHIVSFYQKLYFSLIFFHLRLMNVIKKKRNKKKHTHNTPNTNKVKNETKQTQNKPKT